MAAPIGNEFWKHASRHGREKLFESPELMWEAAKEYFEWCQANPLIETDFRGKDATEVKIPKMRPFTLHGLCLYLGCNTSYFRNFKNQKRVDGEVFSSIISRIEEVIYDQKFTGAAAGFLNPNIIARDLGLRDKTELSTPEDGSAFKITLNIGDKAGNTNGTIP